MDARGSGRGSRCSRPRCRRSRCRRPRCSRPVPPPRRPRPNQGAAGLRAAANQGRRERRREPVGAERARVSGADGGRSERGRERAAGRPPCRARRAHGASSETAGPGNRAPHPEGPVRSPRRGVPAGGAGEGRRVAGPMAGPSAARRPLAPAAPRPGPPVGASVPPAGRGRPGLGGDGAGSREAGRQTGRRVRLGGPPATPALVHGAVGRLGVASSETWSARLVCRGRRRQQVSPETTVPQRLQAGPWRRAPPWGV